jgi:putative ABC transport system permease protein
MKMPFATLLAARQLRYMGLSLVGKFAGVCVAIVLVFIQFGFQNALLNSVLNLDRALIGDIVISGPQFETMGYSPPWFARNLLYKAQSAEGVKAVEPVYIFVGQVREAQNGRPTAARFIAFDPARPVLDLPQIAELLPKLRLPNAVLLDDRSRQGLEPLVSSIGAREMPTLYLQNQSSALAARLDFIGTFSLGPDFALAGNIILSDLNFYRFFQFPLDRVSLAAVTLKPGQDAATVRDRIQGLIGNQAQVSLRSDFIDAERTYFNNETPIGVLFSCGILIGILIGVVFVFEVLHGIIDANLSEYAVLRAMGYRDGFFILLVIQIAIALAVAAFIPSLILTLMLYELIGNATHLSFALTWSTTLAVLAATLTMSVIAVLFALRKLKTSNPIELFA